MKEKQHTALQGVQLIYVIINLLRILGGRLATQIANLTMNIDLLIVTIFYSVLIVTNIILMLLNRRDSLINTLTDCVTVLLIIEVLN